MSNNETPMSNVTWYVYLSVFQNLICSLEALSDLYFLTLFCARLCVSYVRSSVDLRH